MSVDGTLNDRAFEHFRATAAGRAAAVCNPDGSPISGSAGGTSMVDDSPFTVAGSSVTPIGALADDTSPDPVDEGDVGIVRMRRLTRALLVELIDAAGAALGVLATPLRVDPTGTTTQPVSGTVAVSSLPSLPAGSNNIGDVDVLTLPALPAGSNNIGDVDVLSTVLPAGGGLAAGTLSATTTAAQLSSNQACKEVLVQNDPDNTVDVLIGPSGSQPIQLVPGQAVALPVSNVNLVYGKTVSSTGTIAWAAIT